MRVPPSLVHLAFAFFPVLAVGDSAAELRRHFADPPRAYSTMPLWAWNDAVTREKIDRDLEAFQAEHIHGAFVHPRPGLITEYLSEEWFDLWEYALVRARELDMELWIYDENSFPSGFGGGHVAEEMPESVAHPTFLAMEILERPEEADANGYAFVVKARREAGVVGMDDAEAATTEHFYGFKLHREPVSGWYGGSRYVDLLIPGVTETFIDVTMRGYEARFGGALGEAIPGVFTDEPNIAPRGPERGMPGVRWTPSLLEDFEARWGYDLRPHLPSLFEEVGAWNRVRHHYYGLLLELFIERSAKPWYAYTEERGLKWTGHYWEHGWPSPHHGGDNMAMYAWHQMPGIDMLFNNFERRPDQFGNARAVRELASVANQLGRERALSETYGGAGWDLDFADMKRLGDWQAALGVNFMNQHLSYMTLKGRRKGDFPQSFSIHAPYWEDYGVLAHYFHRLSYALTRGEQVHRTLVFEPTTTAWMYYSPGREHPMMERIEEDFRGLLDTLEALQVGYDLASENIVKDHGRARGDRWVVGERAYDRVVFPASMENLDAPTFAQLKAYLSGGGRLLLLGDPPTRVDGRPSAGPAALLRRYAGQVVSLQGRPRAAALEQAGLRTSGFLPRDPPAWGGQVHHMRRELEDGRLFFFANFSEAEAAEVSFVAAGRAAYSLDPLTGEIAAMNGEAMAGGFGLSFTLPPAGSRLCVVLDEPGEAAPPVPDGPTRWAAVDTPTAVEPVAPNSVALDYLDFAVGDSLPERLYFADASDRAFGENGLEQYGRFGHNPWAVAVQYRTNILDMGAGFGADSGYLAEYPFVLRDGFLPEALSAVVEYAHLYDISVNGHPVRPRADGSWWLDPDFSVIDIGAYLRPGENRLTLAVQPMHIHAEVEPVFLVGDFSLEPVEGGFALAPPRPMQLGPWSAQGRPMYSGSVRYTKRFVPEAGMTYRVRLGDWNGTVARVLVNGEQQGILAWKPHVHRLEGLAPGEEHAVTVEVVGSLQNLLGPHHRSPQPGLVTPWSWLIGPGDQPAGADYHVVAYGLFEDFVLEKSDP